jgi:exonuclease VII large subunit
LDKEDVNSLKEGENFLVKKMFITVDSPPTVLSLALALFQVAQMQTNVPLQVKNVIRSVAYMLQKIDEEALSSALVDTLKTQLEGFTHRSRDSVEALSKEIKSLKSTFESKMVGLADEVSGAIEADLATTVNKVTENLTEKIDSANAPYRQALLRDDSSGSAANVGPPDSTTVRVQAQAAIKDRQILVDPPRNSSLSTASSSNASIITRAQEALNQLSPPSDLKDGFAVVTRLRNSGILLVVSSYRLAQRAW